MLDQHCLLCHGWKSGCDDFCGGDYCLKKEKHLKDKETREAKDIHSNDYLLTEG